MLEIASNVIFGADFKNIFNFFALAMDQEINPTLIN